MTKITIEQLAKMIKEGFDKTATKEQFEGLDKRVGGLEKRVGEVEKTLKAMDEKLVVVSATEKRVDYIENVLNISALHAKKN